MSLTSAWSVTAAVRPPRAAFVDHPLGHTSGRAFDRDGQRRIVRAALDLLGTCDEPGTIVDLGERWGDDEWRENPLGGGRRRDGDGGDGRTGGRDSRTPRFDTPQYQSEADARAAAERLGADVACVACVAFDG